MFKIFPGYDLVEKYHNWKKAHRTDDKTMSRAIRLIIAIVAALVVWCLPVENWIDGMTIVQKRSIFSLLREWQTELKMRQRISSVLKK